MNLCCSAEALFAAKRRGSPADMAISIEALCLYQKRISNTPHHGGDRSNEHDYTDDEFIVHIAHPLEHGINVDVRPHVLEEQQASPRPPVMCRQPLQAVQA